jgi:hypothetical protein
VARYSCADERPGHQGLSHRTRIALRPAARPATIALPAGPLAAAVRADLASAGLDASHHTAEVPPCDLATQRRVAGIALTTIGRSIDDDPAFFAVAASAGTLAALRLEVPTRAMRR